MFKGFGLVWLTVGRIAVVVGLGVAMAPGTASATCSCQCVEGVARTACTSIEEAQANPSACGSGMQHVACEVPPAATEAPAHFDPPAGASDCRSARLWDPHSNAYSAVAKVCDLDRAAVASPLLE